jgi:prefoldin subunit 5
VKCALTEAAWAASRTKGTFLSSRYKKLVGRRGKKRAIIAVAHTMLIIAYHLIKEKTHFVELGADYVDERRREAQLKYYKKRIDQLTSCEVHDFECALA